MAPFRPRIPCQCGSCGFDSSTSLFQVVSDHRMALVRPRTSCHCGSCGFDSSASPLWVGFDHRMAPSRLRTSCHCTCRPCSFCRRVSPALGLSCLLRPWFPCASCGRGSSAPARVNARARYDPVAPFLRRHASAALFRRRRALALGSIPLRSFLIAEKPPQSVRLARPHLHVLLVATWRGAIADLSADTYNGEAAALAAICD